MSCFYSHLNFKIKTLHSNYFSNWLQIFYVQNSDKLKFVLDDVPVYMMSNKS